MGASLGSRVHGGLGHGGTSDLPALDLSVNINPYGPCAPVVEAALEARLDRYPDPLATAARAAWASVLESSVEQVAVGHGATDLLWAVVAARTGRGGRVCVAEPTFSELRTAAERAGCEVRAVWAHPDRGFGWDLDELCQALRWSELAYLCSPNNPTGGYLSPETLRALAKAAPDTWIVVDHSFLSLSDHAAHARVRLPENVLVLRSLTKDYAVPGLRIGLLWAHSEIIAEVESARPTWSTSAAAQAAIAAAAGQVAFVRHSFARLATDRERTRAALEAHAFSVLPSCTTFQLVRVWDAAAFQRQLLRHGVLVRDCQSFGLPQYARIAPVVEAGLPRFRKALRALEPGVVGV